LEPPPSVIGRRTEAGMRSGIFFSAIETVDGIVARIKAEWGRPDALVVATGGLAGFLAPHCRSVHTVEPFLTLYGLDFAFRHLEASASGVRVTPLERPGAGRRA